MSIICAVRFLLCLPDVTHRLTNVIYIAFFLCFLCPSYTQHRKKQTPIKTFGLQDFPPACNQNDVHFHCPRIPCSI